jgi:hypothetical protein
VGILQHLGRIGNTKPLLLAPPRPRGQRGKARPGQVAAEGLRERLRDFEGLGAARRKSWRVTAATLPSSRPICAFSSKFCVTPASVLPACGR